MIFGEKSWTSVGIGVEEVLHIVYVVVEWSWMTRVCRFYQKSTALSAGSLWSQECFSVELPVHYRWLHRLYGSCQVPWHESSLKHAREQCCTQHGARRVGHVSSITLICMIVPVMVLQEVHRTCLVQLCFPTCPIILFCQKQSRIPPQSCQRRLQRGRRSGSQERSPEVWSTWCLKSCPSFTPWLQAAHQMCWPPMQPRKFNIVFTHAWTPSSAICGLLNGQLLHA